MAEFVAMALPGCVLGGCAYLVHVNATNATRTRPYGHAWVTAFYGALGGAILVMALGCRGVLPTQPGADIGSEGGSGEVVRIDRTNPDTREIGPPRREGANGTDARNMAGTE